MVCVRCGVATIIPGPMVSDARGSVGGVVFSRGRGGAYVRGRVTPTNPASTRRSLVRQTLASLAQRWGSTLTEAQREGWGLYAAGTPAINRVGQTFYPSGFNRYVAGNSLLIDSPGGAIVDDPPMTPGLGPAAEAAWSSAALDPATKILDLVDLGLLYAAGTDRVLLQAGLPVGPGVQAYYGPYSALTYTGVSNDVTAVVTDPRWSAPALQVGERIPLRFQIVTETARVGVAWETFVTLV